VGGSPTLTSVPPRLRLAQGVLHMQRGLLLLLLHLLLQLLLLWLRVQLQLVELGGVRWRAGGKVQLDVGVGVSHLHAGPYQSDLTACAMRARWRPDMRAGVSIGNCSAKATARNMGRPSWTVLSCSATPLSG
jgi:hypothetical protein